MKQKYVILPAISMALLLTGCGTNKKNNNNTDRAIRVTDENYNSETVRATEPVRENHNKNNNNNNNNIIDDAGDVVDDVIDGGRDVVDDVADAGKDVVDDVVDAGDNAVNDVENRKNNNSNL